MKCSGSSGLRQAWAPAPYCVWSISCSRFFRGRGFSVHPRVVHCARVPAVLTMMRIQRTQALSRQKSTHTAAYRNTQQHSQSEVRFTAYLVVQQVGLGTMEQHMSCYVDVAPVQCLVESCPAPQELSSATSG